MQMPWYAYLIVVLGITFWFAPFVSAHHQTGPVRTVDRRSRWGVLLQLLGYSLLWQGHFWVRPLPLWRICFSISLFAVAALLSWTSSHALAGQLRVDAALGSDHHLVRSGPYRFVRNPIYTSMLCILCATAVIVASWQLFLISLLIFMIGAEIRVRTEEKLLAARFAEEFQEYKRSVGAYIPFV